MLGFGAKLRILGYISTLMSIYQNSDIYTKKCIALIKTIFSIVMKILIYFSTTIYCGTLLHFFYNSYHSNIFLCIYFIFK
jgi:hypothetical protein